MRHVTLFALLVLVLVLPTWAEKPADFDRAELKAMLDEHTDRATRVLAEFAKSEESAGATRPGEMEISIDCDSGRSVNTALRTNPSRYLTIHLSGTCQESLFVDRPGVTLSGTLAGGAIIDPVDDEPAIRAMAAHELRLVDLTLTGASDGLIATASRGMVFERVRAVDNGFWGILLESSTAEITGAELSRNAEPIFAFEHSMATLYDSLIEDNAPYGPWSMRHSNIMAYNTTMRRNAVALFAGSFSNFGVFDSIVGVPGTSAVAWARYQGMVAFHHSEVHSTVIAIESSHLEIFGSTIGTGTDDFKPALWVGYGAYLDVWGGATVINADVWLYASGEAEFWITEPIHGDVNIFEFGEGIFYTDAPIDGAVRCWDRGRAFASPDPAGGMHGCE